MVLIQEFGDWQDGEKIEVWETTLDTYQWYWNLQDVTEVWEERIVEELAEVWERNKVEAFQQVERNTSVLGRGMAIGVRKDLSAIIQKNMVVDRRASKN